MTTLKMKLGNGYVDVTVPEENLLGIILKDIPSSGKTEEDAILSALANPIGSRRLGEMVKPGNSVCIVVSDVTRAWQRMSVYLPFLVKELNDVGVRDEDIRFLSGVGLHRKQTEEEHVRLLGPELTRRFRVVDHDCRDEKNLVNLGKTNRGMPITINKMAADADHLRVDRLLHLSPVGRLGGGKKSICLEYPASNQFKRIT